MLCRVTTNSLIRPVAREANSLLCHLLCHLQSADISPSLATHRPRPSCHNGSSAMAWVVAYKGVGPGWRKLLRSCTDREARSEQPPARRAVPKCGACWSVVNHKSKGSGDLPAAGTPSEHAVLTTCHTFRRSAMQSDWVLTTGDADTTTYCSEVADKFRAPPHDARPAASYHPLKHSTDCCLLLF